MTKLSLRLKKEVTAEVEEAKINKAKGLLGRIEEKRAIRKRYIEIREEQISSLNKTEKELLALIDKDSTILQDLNCYTDKINKCGGTDSVG